MTTPCHDTLLFYTGSIYLGGSKLISRQFIFIHHLILLLFSKMVVFVPTAFNSFTQSCDTNFTSSVNCLGTPPKHSPIFPLSNLTKCIALVHQCLASLSCENKPTVFSHFSSSFSLTCLLLSKMQPTNIYIYFDNTRSLLPLRYLGRIHFLAQVLVKDFVDLGGNAELIMWGLISWEFKVITILTNTHTHSLLRLQDPGPFALLQERVDDAAAVTRCSCRCDRGPLGPFVARK